MTMPESKEQSIQIIGMEDSEQSNNETEYVERPVYADVEQHDFSQYQTRERYNEELPERLQKYYQSAARDNDLLNMRDDIALIEAGIQDSVRRLSTKDPGELWIKARMTYRDLVLALRMQDDRESTRLMTLLGNTLEIGYTDALAWQDIERKQEVKRKMVDTERKRMMDMQQVITTEDFMKVVGSLVDSIRRRITDEDILRYISDDIRQVLKDQGM